MTPVSEPDEWVFDTVKAPAMTSRRDTTKRRKLSAIHGNGQLPIEAFERLDLKDTPLNYASPSTDTVRRSSTRKRSCVVQDGPPPIMRRISHQKQPLQADLSFGNQASTVRVFRRVSDNSVSVQTPNDSGIVDENTISMPHSEVATKESLLGHRLYQKVIDPALQELHAQNGHQMQREATSRLADAWAALDAVDPEGVYHVMRCFMERMQHDSKLSALLPPPKDISKDALVASAHQPAKLVLAQNNPHLRSHRRRQSSIVEEPKDRLHQLPGQVVAGMEHTKQLADVLYGRWAHGMKNRWPVV